MPLVPKRHGYHQFRHHLRDFSAPRNASLTIENPVLEVGFQLHGALVLSAGLFLVLILGYLFRRQIRSVPSRLAHAISVHGSTSSFIHIHLHTMHYSPLHDHDTTADIESPIEEEEPAPPYSAPLEQRPVKERNLRSTRPLQITVPPRPTFSQSTQQYGREIGMSQTNDASASERMSIVSTPSLLSDAGSSSAASSPVSSISSSGSQSNLIDIDNTSKASALDLATPRASRWDAFPRSYGYMSANQNNNRSNNNRAPKSSHPSDIMTTESPCATPPPQYTITIHSSPRARTSDGEGRPTPDIILSPVPWLPREYVPPPSPPHYLSVPKRKSKSRVQSNITTRAEKEKPLPPFPRQNKEQSSKFNSDVEIKQRHASLKDVSSKPTSSSRSSLPLGFNVPRRSATLPLQTHVVPPPAPQPILPIDLEAVYPTSPTEEMSGKQSESDSPWLWRSRSPAPSKDRSLNVAGEMKSGMEKRQYNEKDNSSDSDDVPLAQTLVLAMRRKKERMSSTRPTIITSPVSQVFKKQFFGRLSALAARARSAIEHEFESSDEEEEEEGEEEDVPIGEKAVLARRAFVERDMQAVDTFIIGDEE